MEGKKNRGITKQKKKARKTDSLSGASCIYFRNWMQTLLSSTIASMAYINEKLKWFLYSLLLQHETMQSYMDSHIVHKNARGYDKLPRFGQTYTRMFIEKKHHMDLLISSVLLSRSNICVFLSHFSFHSRFIHRHITHICPNVILVCRPDPLPFYGHTLLYER